MKKYILLCLMATRAIFCTTYTVINNNPTGVGSLREAITLSNADTAQPNIIDFAIVGSATINLVNASGPLPNITHTVTIDGTTQTGYSPNPAPIGTPVVVLNGAALTPADFLSGFFIKNNLATSTNDCVIKGIVIQNFIGLNDSSAQFNAGVCITSDGGAPVNNNQVLNCYIGTNATGTVAARNGNGGVNIVGTTPSSPGSGNCNNNVISNNLISGNTQGNGITLFQNVFSTVIQGNFIGTDITGTALLPNSAGIVAFGTLAGDTEQVTDTLIGGTSPGQGNLISGNGTFPNGVEIFLASNVFNTTIQGNLFGTDKSGTQILTGYVGTNGIYLFGPISGAASETVTGTIIGGAAVGAGNVFAGYTAGAIILQDHVSTTVISGNFIGTDTTGTVSMPNSFGIYIMGDPGFPSTQNTVTDNLIKFNTSNGVIVDGGSGLTAATLNPILGNSIFLNMSNGISLVNNGNDTQAIPTIISAATGSGIVAITAMAPATPAASNFRLEFFLNTANHNPITEGQTFIGAMSSVPSGTTATQNFTFAGAAVGQWVSATATNLNGPSAAPGDTSPFTLNTSLVAGNFILPPNSASAQVKKNAFLAQTDIVNQITWTAPSGGTVPASYRLFRDAGLTQLIATVPASTLQYDDHNRKKGVTYTYYIVSVDAQGNISSPISVAIVS